MIKNEIEIWRSHPEIGIIEVSSLGRVRTLDRVVSSKGNGTRFQKGQVLKQFINSNGYMRVPIRIDGKQMHKFVHRLVAQTFIKNPDNLPEVNHLDCDRENNNVENLEFCTASYNRQYREKYGISQTEAAGHPLFAINLATREVSRFRSQHESSRVLRVLQPNVNAVIKGKQKKAHGYLFVNDDDNAADIIKRKLEEA